MTENSLFQEVDEDLQRQKMEAIWKRYGNLILAGALVVVLATAAINTWRAHMINVAQKATGGILSINDDKSLSGEKQADLLTSFAAALGNAPQAVVARFHAASLLMREGKADRGTVLYKELAADPSVEKTFRQLAELFTIQADLDAGDPVALQARLQPLITDSPWRPSAKEFSAFLYLRAGDKTKAAQLFQELSQEAEIPESISARALDMYNWLNEGKEPAQSTSEGTKADEKK